MNPPTEWVPSRACRGLIMRWKAILVASCVAPAVGCQLTQSAVHNLVNEPIEYFDGKKVTRQLRDEAEDVLEDQYGRRVVTDDFKDGFIDGYADFLERGGNTTPPAVPPLKYRRGKYLNAEGHAQIHDYFCGFQAGADAAAQSGRRQFLTVPILLPDTPPPPPVNARQIPAEQCLPGTTVASPPTVTTAPQLPARTPEPTAELPALKRPVADPTPPLPMVPPPAVKAEPPIADPPSPELPVPKISLPVSPPPTAGYRSISATGVMPDDPDGVPRMVVPPLRELPHKPGHSQSPDKK